MPLNSLEAVAKDLREHHLRKLMEDVNQGVYPLKDARDAFYQGALFWCSSYRGRPDQPSDGAAEKEVCLAMSAYEEGKDIVYLGVTIPAVDK